MRLLKKFILFASELSFLFFGFLFSIGFSAYLADIGNKFAIATLLLEFLVITAALVWFRRKTEKWTVTADAEAWLADRSSRKDPSQRARYVRVFRHSLLWLPSLCAAFALFFLPAASHVIYSGTHLVPHYRFSPPLNWLIIKIPGINRFLFLFNEKGINRYGFTPLRFSDFVPSSAEYFSSDPSSSDEWAIRVRELASRHTYVATRKFQLGMISATCYEYRYPSHQNIRFSDFPEMWESQCSTQPDGVDYNLGAVFFGHREDLPVFYDVLNSVTPAN